jgi:release factor glutamine methyltransferase
VSLLSVAEALALANELQSDTARLDVEILLSHVLGQSRAWLYTWPEALLTSVHTAQYQQLLGQRKTGVPVAYLVGQREFWSLPIKVNDTTLIPRPDTEILVESAIPLLESKTARILDLGTGTGAIALALASESESWSITGVDQSGGAIKLAEENAKALGLDVRFLQSNWFSAIPLQHFDMILSNPPYIAEGDPHLKQGDVVFEPTSALVSGVDGLDDIRKIISQAPDFLRQGGWLLLEHGSKQAAAITVLLQQAGFSSIATRQDLSARDRVTLAQWHD